MQALVNKTQALKVWLYPLLEHFKKTRIVIMKITDFKTYIIGNPPPSFGGKYWIFLKLTTDSGIVGFGEAYAIPFHPSVATKMIEDICQRYVVGESPF